MKKSTLLVVFIAVALIAGTAFGQLAKKANLAKKNYGLLFPTLSNGIDENISIRLTAEEAKHLMKNPGDVKHYFNEITTIIDTLQIPLPEIHGYPYFGGSAGDSMAVFFSPGAGCKILKIGFNCGYNGNNTATPLSSGVNVSLHFANYNGEAEAGGAALYELGKWTDGVWTPTDWYKNNYPNPPIGELFWGDFPLTPIVEPANSWEELEMSWLGYEADCLGKDFVVLLAPYGGTADAALGWEDLQNWNPPAPYRIWKYYSPDYDVASQRNTWYCRLQVSFACYCIVEFYENTPPSISGVNQLSSTYDGNKDFIVQATMTDIDASDEAKGGIAEAYLVWELSTGTTDSVSMNNVGGNLWEGKLPALTAPVSVTYWASAKDKGSPSLYSTSPKFNFEVAEPKNPNADLLLVLQGPHSPDFYRNALSNLGFVYEEWDANANYGIDASVASYGWGTILIAGWGANTVPTRGYAGNAYASFLNNGGNLYLSDMDYFFGNGELGDVDLTFISGEFAYDFFGLAGGVSDPTGAAHVDSLISGVGNDPISGVWAETPYNLSWYRYWTDIGNLGVDNNWTDYVTPGSATKIFTAESGNDAGVRYEGSNFKTVYLSFMADAAGDSAASADFDKLIENVLTWFGTKKEDSVERVDNGPVVNSYRLSQNYPNPFNPVTSIEYNIPEAARVTLTVYNVLGKKITELVNENQKPGIYKVTWDAKNAANGVYFYKLETGNYSKTLKMLLLR